MTDEKPPVEHAGEQEKSVKPEKAVTTEKTAATTEGAVKKEPPARPAKAPAPPDPRVIEATAYAESLKAEIEKACGAGVIAEISATKSLPVLRVEQDAWYAVVKFLKEDPEQQFLYIRVFAGTDYKDYIEVIFEVHSFVRGRRIRLKTRTPRDPATLESLTPLFAGLNWEEREAYDLLGIHFTGHPDLRRIMMWEEWNGHPLRKDFSEFENAPHSGGDTSE